MEVLAVDADCPQCGLALTLLGEDAGPVECPDCGCEFAVDADGRVVDDGGLDPSGLWEINADGEPDAEGLRTVRCPRCSAAHEVGEPGLTGCRHCRTVFVVDDEGRVEDGVVYRWPCPRCGTVGASAHEPIPFGCDACGLVEDEDQEPDREESALDCYDGFTCPHCGYDDDFRGFALRPLDGRVVCMECEHAFLPGREGGFEGPVRPDHIVPVSD